MLTDTFPTAVRINGECYPVRSDFRTGLKIMEAFEDTRLTAQEKQAVMLDLLFPNIPPDIGAAMRAAVKFLDCGRTREEEPPGGRVYSFTKDAQYIYSAVLQTYGVDLQTADMHWWKFVAMFGDLSEDTTFEKIRIMRDRHNRGKLTKEEQAAWAECRELLDLEYDGPDEETMAAREKFDSLLRG